MFKNALFAVILLMIFGFESFSQFISPPFLSTESERWADSVLRTMNRKECIGQLFMISAYSNKDSKIERAHV